jgi:protein-S-isoprenylcysteine O-methyltransferase Ste14
VRSEALGKAIVVVGLVLFGALMFSLFFPMGSNVPLEIVGATTLLAVGFLAAALVRGS